MKFRKSYLLQALSATVLLLATGCSKVSSDTGSLYTPTAADVTANATLQQLQQGRALYIDNCNSCHSLYSPDGYSPAQWTSILNNMGPRTSLSVSELGLVSKYVSRGVN
jgi:mono/diheme cytochrome c family protein